MANFIRDGMTQIIGKLLGARSTVAMSGVANQYTIEASYLGSGMMRKCINIPAEDAVRDWREWQSDNLELIEAEEQRLAIAEKIKRAEILRRMGGGALILGVPGEPSQPAPSKVSKGGLAFIHVVNRWQLQLIGMQDDPTQPGYGEPLQFRMQTKGGQVDIHPSRVITFRGEPFPDLNSSRSEDDRYWGESRVMALKGDVDNYEAVKVALSRYVAKAGYMRVGIPDLAQYFLDADSESKLHARIAAIAGEATALDAVVYDRGNGAENPGEDITDAPISLTGIVDTLNGYGQQVAAVADIPATRLLGQSAKGMNSSGDSEQKDWNKTVASIQTSWNAQLHRLDNYLLASAGVSDADYTWPPLSQLDPMQEATRFKTMMEGVEKAQGTGAIPDIAFSKGVQSLFVEEGWLPALEQALADTPEDELFPVESAPFDPNAADPNALAQTANDASPRTLYVSRKVTNAKDILDWAKRQGFTETLTADDLHVTVLYSRTPVDWMKMGDNWSDNGKGGLTVPAGGARIVEPLGDKGAVVLLFSSSSLIWRHEDMVRNGASHDYAEYQPHVTISYNAGDLDLSKVEPYRGKIEFGPEIFEELDLDWTPKAGS